MDVMFYGVPGLMAAGALFAAITIMRRWWRIRAAWNSGLTAQGRCLRVYSTTHGGHNGPVRTSLHHVYEFATRDGRVIRFEEQHGPATVLEGDQVTVHYTDGPQVVATAHPPRRLVHDAGTFLLLAFLGVFVVLCAGFAMLYHEMSTTFFAW